MIYKGGAKVGQGTYWDIKRGERIAVAEGAILPGEGVRAYIKAPDAAIVLAAPVVGLAFVILFPIIGSVFAMVLVARRMLGRTGDAIAKHISFGWKPREAYLSGRNPGRRKAETEDTPTYANVNDILDALHGRNRR